MAELILTDDEKEAATYLDWDDEALGKLVRHFSKKLHDEYGQDGTFVTGAAHLLVDMALRANATKSELALKAMTRDGEPIGDWKIEVKRISHNAEAQLPPEQAQPAEGTQSAAALWAVNCSDLLCVNIRQTAFDAIRQHK